ncbi:hypothetical protein GF361_00455 [Candidatus Woesearchaeota archaeon]|nr:hypothetical protein [Candidatus Woesearchaeota archaeon]
MSKYYSNLIVKERLRNQLEASIDRMLSDNPSPSTYLRIGKFYQDNIDENMDRTTKKYHIEKAKELYTLAENGCDESQLRKIKEAYLRLSEVAPPEEADILKKKAESLECRLYPLMKIFKAMGFANS